MAPTKSILKTSGSSSSSSSCEYKQVGWGDMEIYEFPNILGDHPCAQGGAPLSIGWQHENKDVVGIDYFEYLRQSRPRRKRKALLLSSAERDTFLLGIGYSLQELMDAADETYKIRKSRQASMKGRFDTFKKVFNLTVTAQKTKTKVRSVAAKGA